jgi:hypothetical protein
MRRLESKPASDARCGAAELDTVLVVSPRLAMNAPVPSDSRVSAGTASFWVVEGAVLCACPDCRAPMSVRLWLGIADCWNCGAAIELTEEQEREIERVLQKGATPAPTSNTASNSAAIVLPTNAPAVPKPNSAPAPLVRQEPARPESTPSPTRPPVPVSPPPAAAKPTPPSTLPPPPPAVARPAAAPGVATRKLQRRRRRDWIRDLLRDMPAWLISLLLHMLLFLLLGLLNIQEKTEAPFITISTTVSREKAEGEFTIEVDDKDEVAFNLPLPDNMDLKNKQTRDALIAANQDARQLQIDPELPVPNMPALDRVRDLAASDDPVRRSIAVRDPRLRVEVVKQEGGTTLTEAAVSRGLRWLASQQRADGGWSNGNSGFDTANTALALMPFLGAGQTPTVGPYRNHVAKGLRWLKEKQKADGDLRGGASQHPGMYAHGIASIVMCDAFALTGDESLRKPAQLAVDFIVAAQNDAGGWRYFPRQDADLSVVGWQLMALQSGRMAGLKVPSETLELADQYLDSVSHEEGALYSYQRQGGEARPTPTMTAEGLLCRMYLGWRKDTPGLVRGVEVLSTEFLPEKRQPNIYYWYYGTQVFHHYGGPEWERWNLRMRDILVDSQVTQGPHAGSWHPEGDRWGSAGGRIFVTSLSVCSLEVYYRHAPIYRQLKLD